MIKKLAILFLLATAPLFAQGYSYSSQISQELTTTQITGTTNVVVIPTTASVSFCSYPANAVPCTNKATTYTSITLGTSCPTSTQIVLIGTTTCVASPDSQMNWNVYIGAGTYSYTITLPNGVNLGPYVVSLGIPSGTSLTLGAIVGTSLNQTVFADQQTGTDPCAKINTSFGLSQIGAPINAQGFTDAYLSATPCITSPFASLSSSKSGQIWLRGTFQIEAQWSIPATNGVSIIGTGRGTPGYNTTVQAVTGFPASTPLIKIPSGSAVSGIQLSQFAVACNNISGAIGVQNNAGQEETLIDHMLITDCPAIGLDLESATQNSGPYQNLEVFADSGCTNCTTATILVKAAGSANLRGIKGLTMNADTAPAVPNVGLSIQNAGTYEDIHSEGSAVGIDVTTSNVTLKNIECGATGTTTCIKIESGAKNVQIINASSAAGGSTNIISDLNTGCSMTVTSDGGGVSFYSTGNQTSENIVSSSTTCGNRFGSVPTISGNNVVQTIGTGNLTSLGTIITTLTCQTEGTITVSGATQATDQVIPFLGIALPATFQTGIQLKAEITAANTVSVYLCNPTAGSITPAATQINVKVVR